ncbi:MAG: DNA mismatch repair endonuclease MutL [Halolamina sp.]
MTDREDDSEEPTVRRLPETVVDRVAAGEIVTRPARVVAELVDNALDAGAATVAVEVGDDGTDLIRVRDDGHGMSRVDAARARERHATSKVRDGDDLRVVDTLGFRGEALAAVDEVASLELLTNDGGDVATRVGPDGAVSDAARARGTTVTVRDLFADVPARRASLGAAATEYRRVAETVTAYALARPDVAFSLRRDGRETLSTPGSGDDADAVLAVYDRETAARASEFIHDVRADALDASELSGDLAASLDGDALADGPTLRVEGLLAYPSTTRADRSALHVAVNGRPVAAPEVARAVERGYGALLPEGRHPVAVVRLSLPPRLVDANVHPAKREVGLVAGDAVADAVSTGVDEALTTADLRRAGEVAMDLETGVEPRTAADSDLAEVEVLGQFRELYLLCADGDELLVVDQHAAHERVNYERLSAAVAESAVPTAELDPPATPSLSPSLAAAVEEHAADLAALGFDAEPFGGSTVKLSGVPAPLGRTADADAFRETLSALVDGERPAPREELLAELACHPSLKAGDELAASDAAALVERLGACDQPYACPHGRPTVLSLPAETLVRGFERESRLG